MDGMGRELELTVLGLDTLRLADSWESGMLESDASERLELDRLYGIKKVQISD
jgi:hypothetical protein